MSPSVAQSVPPAYVGSGALVVARVAGLVLLLWRFGDWLATREVRRAIRAAELEKGAAQARRARRRELEGAVHGLWSKAVGTHDYRKAEWLALMDLLTQADGVPAADPKSCRGALRLEL